jgi:teichuronic acid biosynthesis glycosyltransferase TuaC
MRIGVITTSYPRSHDDPAGSFVAASTRWLSRYADVDVVCADGDGSRFFRFGAPPLFYGGGAPGALASGGMRAWLQAAGFSARLLIEAARRARRWDAIVSHWLVPSAAIGMLLSGNRPHVAVAHGSDTRLLGRLPGGPAFARALVRRADLVYVARALELEGAPGRVAPMGIDCVALRGGDRGGTRRALGLDGFTVLYLGRLSHEKGPDLALRALPERTTLLMAGDGPLRSSLRGARLLGEVRGRAKIDLLAACDALIVPSRIDGAPVVVLEAMAAGLPIVATRTGGIPELVTDGHTALLCEPDAPALARALSRLRDSPSLRLELSENAARAALAHDWSRAGPQIFHTLMHRLIPRNTGHPVDTISTSNRRIVVARC